MQKKVDFWRECLKDIYWRINDIEMGRNDTDDLQRAYRQKSEFMGRIYAARQFADILGIELDTEII